jgi:trimethylamine:corrinoid methyltransferase-like protein
MGHPGPFKLKLLGVGNEQWGEDYFARYPVFQAALKAKHPEITLITTAGPGGAFLSQKDTAKRVRAGEHYLPTLSTRLSYDKWVEQGTTEYDDACARVEALLAAHALKEPYIDGSRLEELAAVCRVDEDMVRQARRA